VVRIYNGFSVDSEASYKALYVAAGAKCPDVIRVALDRNGKLKDHSSEYVIVIEEGGEVKQILKDEDSPLAVNSEIQQDEKRAKRTRLVLHRKGFDNPAIRAKFQDPNATQTIRVFCDMHLTKYVIFFFFFFSLIFFFLNPFCPTAAKRVVFHTVPSMRTRKPRCSHSWRRCCSSSSSPKRPVLSTPSICTARKRVLCASFSQPS